MTPDTLVFEFYGEGLRDYGFLMPLVNRSIEWLTTDLDVRSIALKDVPVSGLSQIDKMRRVAEAGYKSCRFIVFHLDADAPSTKRAYTQRFQPGHTAILTAPDSARLNRQLVPVIPVRMTEAWMLTDLAAFQKATATRLSAKELNFPTKPHQVESIRDPKAVFEAAVGMVNRKKRSNVSFNALYERLADIIDLDTLNHVPAYREFTDRLRTILQI